MKLDREPALTSFDGMEQSASDEGRLTDRRERVGSSKSNGTVERATLSVHSKKMKLEAVHPIWPWRADAGLFLTQQRRCNGGEHTSRLRGAGQNEQEEESRRRASREPREIRREADEIREAQEAEHEDEESRLKKTTSI